ncbi:MAG TPA: hypothetical protein VF788_10135 [Pseudonocardiaceae bacterium]
MDWTAEEFTFFVDGAKYTTGTSVDSAFDLSSTVTGQLLCGVAG